MQDNSKNKKWVNELDTLESLPGEDTDLQSSWTKLHSRRKNSSKAPKAVWYWLAAACFASVISLPLFFNKKATGNRAGNLQLAIIKKPAQQKIYENLQMQEVPEIVAVSPAAKLKRKISIPVVMAKTSAVASVRNENDLVQNTQVLPVKDTFYTAMAVSPAKKKMPVVHINDIENTINNKAYTQQEGKPYFPVKFKSREVLTSNTAPGAGLDNLIRIKLSPQN